MRDKMREVRRSAVAARAGQAETARGVVEGERAALARELEALQQRWGERERERKKERKKSIAEG